MAKRLTDSNKWDDPWYQELSPNHKLAWDYITSKCDSVGVWKPSERSLVFHINMPVDLKKFLAICGPERIRLMPNGNWWIVKFCDFQYGELKEDSKSPTTQSYIRLLKKHTLWIGYTKGIYTPKEKEIEKETEEEKEKEGELKIVYETVVDPAEPINLKVNIPLDKNAITSEILTDQIFIENLQMAHRGKDITQAWEECWLHHSTGKAPPVDVAGWKQKLNGWLSNKKADNGKKGNGVTAQGTLDRLNSYN